MRKFLSRFSLFFGVMALCGGFASCGEEEDDATDDEKKQTEDNKTPSNNAPTAGTVNAEHLFDKLWVVGGFGMYDDDNVYCMVRFNDMAEYEGAEYGGWDFSKAELREACEEGFYSFFSAMTYEKIEVNEKGVLAKAGYYYWSFIDDDSDDVSNMRPELHSSAGGLMWSSDKKGHLIVGAEDLDDIENTESIRIVELNADRMVIRINDDEGMDRTGFGSQESESVYFYYYPRSKFRGMYLLDFKREVGM